MRVTTNDGRFGFLLNPLPGGKFFRLAIEIGGLVVGDQEPSLIWGDLQAFRRLNPIDDPRADPCHLPLTIRRVLLADEDLYESSLLGLGETFDRWLVRGYLWGEVAVLVVGLHDDEQSTVIETIGASEYFEVVRVATAALRYDE
jgi:hypothetical protein